MSRRYDPDQIAELAKKVGKLKDSYSAASTDLGDGNPSGAYGDLKNADSSAKSMQGFYSGVNKELDAAGKLVDSAARALAKAAERMHNDEDDSAHSFGGGDPERA